ncbi:MAG: hypothetical protein IPI67_28445 [Myxococcales bacterium]|nr:hypothetical protein [Myxococcales bacterium]
MGGFFRLGWALSFLLLVACGGSEFGSDQGTGGSDAGTGATGGSGGTGNLGGSSGQSGSGGQGGTAALGGTGGAVDAGTDVGSYVCSTTLHGKDCMAPQVTTGDPTCDTCGRQQCCTQTNACLADALCAQTLRCYLDNCIGVSATACVLSACQACISPTLFLPLSSCLQTKCSASCPTLIP